MLIERTIKIDGTMVTITQRVETEGKSDNKHDGKDAKLAIVNESGAAFTAAAEVVSKTRSASADEADKAKKAAGAKSKDSGGGGAVPADTGGGGAVPADTGGGGVVGRGENIVVFGPIVIHCAGSKRVIDDGGGEQIGAGTGGVIDED